MRIVACNIQIHQHHHQPLLRIPSINQERIVYQTLPLELVLPAVLLAVLRLLTIIVNLVALGVS
jgi:hypothetical protein